VVSNPSNDYDRLYRFESRRVPNYPSFRWLLDPDLAHGGLRRSVVATVPNHLHVPSRRLTTQLIDKVLHHDLVSSQHSKLLFPLEYSSVANSFQESEVHSAH
jgi:hypothetical protein